MTVKPILLRATWAALAVGLVACEGSPTGAEDQERAAHTISLGSSDFEIESFAGMDDDGADLVLDTDSHPDAIDWAEVTEFRQEDEFIGKDDSSFGKGTKEDTTPPVVKTGSIPPNKSDLRFFGVYEEVTATDQYLHLFWTRVQDPSGTTLMDFEFNQVSSEPASLIRTAGDLLVVYKLSSGGDGDNGLIDIVLHRWQTGIAPYDGACEAASEYPCWGEEQDLSGSGLAVGSINNVTIPAGESDGLGELSPRTFGEATIDLSAIFPDDSCFTLGQAWLKSRASDTFTTTMKDYIPPRDINISNCGKVIIRKQTDPDGATERFDFTSTVLVGSGGSGDSGDSGGDSADSGDTGFTNTPASFKLADDEYYEIVNVLLGDDLEVVELDPSGKGYTLKNIDCSASTGVTPDSVSTMDRKVVFDIDDPDDILDCTFYNEGKASLKIIKTTVPSGLQQKDFSFAVAGPNAFSDSFMLSNLSDGSEAKTYSNNLTPGSYSVTETIPSGWRLNSFVCVDKNNSDAVVDMSSMVNDNVANLTLAAGDDIECTYENEPLAKVGGFFTSLATANAGTYGYLDMDISCTGQSDDTGMGVPSVLNFETVKHSILRNLSSDSIELPSGTYDCVLVIKPNSDTIPMVP